MEEVPRLVAVATVLAVLSLVVLPAEGAERRGLIAGTVFQSNGLSLPGASVSVVAAADDPDSRKPRPWTAVSDARGEFAIRVPAGSMRYNVSVEAEGFEPQEKQVQVEWDQRVDVYFRLRPAVQPSENSQ